MCPRISELARSRPAASAAAAAADYSQSVLALTSPVWKLQPESLLTQVSGHVDHTCPGVIYTWPHVSSWQWDWTVNISPDEEDSSRGARSCQVRSRSRSRRKSATSFLANLVFACLLLRLRLAWLTRKSNKMKGKVFKSRMNDQYSLWLSSLENSRL